MKTLVFVLSAALAVGQSARVEGKVVSDTGDAVSKAEVRLQDTTGRTLPSVATGSDGKFVFEDVPPGRYTLEAEKAGFLPQNLVRNNGAVLNLAAGAELKDLVIKLVAQSVISGKITDQDGDPMAGANVTVWRYSFLRGVRQLRRDQLGAVANDLGEYRLINLTPGRYYLSAAPKAPAAVGDLGRPATEMNLSTLYPSALDSASAKQLDVTDGGKLQGIDIRLRSANVYTVKGKVMYPTSGAPVAAGSLYLIPPDADPIQGAPFGEVVSTTLVQADGTFEFRNVIPGTYIVVADTVMPAGGDRIRFQPGPQVTVVASNVENLSISLKAAGPISGVVIAEEGDLQTLLKSKTARVTLRLLPSVGLTGAPTSASSNDDGTFRIVAGSVKYRWSASLGSEEVCVKSATFGEQDVTRALIDNLSGEGGVLRIVLSAKAASLSGTAPRGTTVRIWPQIPNLGDMSGGMRTATPDQNGKFRFAGLRPEVYYIAAWGELEPGLAESPEFLARFTDLASLVKLEASGSATVEVKLIPGDRVAAEIARLP